MIRPLSREMLIDKYDVNVYEAIIRSSTGCEEIQSRGLLHSASYSAFGPDKEPWQFYQLEDSIHR